MSGPGTSMGSGNGKSEGSLPGELRFGGRLDAKIEIKFRERSIDATPERSFWLSRRWTLYSTRVDKWISTDKDRTASYFFPGEDFFEELEDFFLELFFLDAEPLASVSESFFRFSRFII